MNTRPRLALLIDAENLHDTSEVPKILDIIERELGTATLKRAYGDFTSGHQKAWKEALAAHAIQPFQQFPIVAGKNATDIALVIDCIDLHYSRRFDGFCVVSSDSDFSRLAIRIREDGTPIYGFGKASARAELKVAFNRYFPIDTPAKKSKPAKAEKAKPVPAPKRGVLTDTEFGAMKRVIADCAGKDGYASLGELGNAVKREMPHLKFRSLKVLLKKDSRFAFGEGVHANSVKVAG